MMLIRTLLASLSTRKLVSSLIVVAIALSLALLLAVDRLRHQVKHNFTSTVSGIDLIVGARGSATNLLLYSVFRLSDANSGIRWNTVDYLAQHPDVAWWIPIALGDYHRGFPVVGTQHSYFQHYRYGNRQPLALAQGQWFSNAQEVVLGSAVATQLGYGLGDSLTLSHGAGGPSIISHDDHSFVVTGILEPTGTPVDSSLHIDLSAMAALHNSSTFISGVPPAQSNTVPTSVNAVMLGLERRTAILGLQRELSRYSREPLTAIIPGVELQRLWRMTAQVETVLRAVGWLVLMVSLLVLMAALLAALDGRRHELAVLRAAGAGRWTIYRLLLGESLCLAALGCLSGLLLLSAAQWWLAPWVLAEWSFRLPQHFLAWREGPLVMAVLAAGSLMGVVPAERAFRNSLADGLTPRN